MLRVVALCFAACALLAAWSQGQQRLGRGATVAAAATVAVALLVPRWDMKLMTNGANVYFDTQPLPDELVFVREDVHGGLTSVARRGEVLTLYTNGKFQGDNGHEVTAQHSFAHFPSLFVQEHGRALVVGVGTGTTLGTIAAYPYRDIDVAEISPAIVEAARRYFAEPNRHGLDDPRVRLLLEDGRNVLLLASQPYDLVTIELSSVWFAGAANLYSREFYELVRSRLTPSGILQQWVQLHHIHRRELAVTLRTVRSAFDHVALFVSGGQGIIVAGMQPLVASRRQLAALSREPAIAETLTIASSLEQLLERLLVSGAELDRFVAETELDGAPALSTDENLYLEYATPKGNVMRYDESIADMIATLSSYRVPGAGERHLGP
jgi:spermidine synthase